jgi:hypothetical protein
MLSLLFSIVVAAHSIDVDLPSGPGPLTNPLKGFAPWSTEGTQLNTAVSMAYVDASWRALEPKDGEFQFQAWEDKAWNTSIAKGKRVVFRVWIDYPGQSTGVPQWLIDSGVKMNPYTDFGGGVSPDYQNPRLQSALLKFIQALGQRYDRNPRVAIVEVGLLGHWGEWHTYPRTELFASDETQKKVIDAMKAAFPDKPLEARNPAYASCHLPWIGFHDDMIPEDTLGTDAWQFLPSLTANGLAENWKVAPAGGEMVPGAGKKYLGESWDLLLDAVKRCHFTWIGPYSPPMEAGVDATFRARQDAIVRLMGYQFRLTKFKIDDRAIEVDGLNEGVAPFYEPWQVKMVLIDGQGNVVGSWAVDADVRKWLPGSFSVHSTVPAQVRSGEYRLAIGIMDPMTLRPGVQFANALSTSAGYTVLGKIDLK